MKCVLLSVRPQWVVKILNGEKTIEVRKHFPKDYVGWVYIYCTKNENKKLYFSTFHGKYMVAKYVDHKHKVLNGKVVARFWCDKVEEITFYSKKPFDRYGTPYRATYDLLTESCLEYDELDNYLNKNNGYAIHITKLEIFDEPKEISEFKRDSGRIGLRGTPHGNTLFHIFEPLTRAPESYCYIEV